MILLNKFSFICTHTKTKQQQQKRKNISLEKSSPSQAGRGMGENLLKFTGDRYVQGILQKSDSFLTLVTDGSVRWQLKAREECWKGGTVRD